MRKLFLTGMVLFWTASSFAQDPLPVAKYHLDESTWNGTFNEVKDVSGNNLHGTAVNGALTANSTPAIPSINNLGTCGYGSFEHDNNQYVNIADNNILDLNETLTVSAWINPSSGPSSGLFSIFSKDSNFEVHIDSSRRVFGGGKKIMALLELLRAVLLCRLTRGVLLQLGMTFKTLERVYS